MKYLSIENELEYAKKRYEFTKEIETIFVNKNYIQFKPNIFEDYDEFRCINRRIETDTMVKVVGDKILVLRPDITTSIIKNIIPRYEEDLILKLFYHSTVYKNCGKEGIKEIRQFGCEYLGDKSIEADKEIVNMALDILQRFGNEFLLEIGNSNYINGLFQELNLTQRKEDKLKGLLLRKNKLEVKLFTDELSVRNEVKDILYNLLDFNGEINDIVKRARSFYRNEKMEKGLKELEKINKEVFKCNCRKFTNFDLSMIAKFDYYEGIMIKGYYANVYKEILSGGRYDSLTEEFGRRVPAIGFCIDVDGLMEAHKERGI